MKKIILFIFMLQTAFTLSAHAAQQVTVSIPPQKYIVDKITGGKIAVNVLVPTGSDPHTFSPKSSQIKNMADSKLYLAIGFPFEESTLPQIAKSLRDLVIVETQGGIELIEETHGHSYDKDGEHEEDDVHGAHEHMDPHVWTSPKAVRKITENTYKALTTAFPGEDFAKGYAALAEEIDSIDNDFTELFKTSVNKVSLVYHPSFSYFARDYGLTQYAVERDGKEPKASELKETIDIAKKNKIKVFIIQPNQSPAAARTVATELKITPVNIDILDEDWPGMMLKVYNAFAQGK